jgi:hypothetical protein
VAIIERSTVFAPSLLSAKYTAVLWAPMQLPEITIASQSLLKTGFRNANQVEVLQEVSFIGYGLDDAILDDFIVREQENDRVYGIGRCCAVDELFYCSGPGSALVVTFTPCAASALAAMGETTPVRITA